MDVRALAGDGWPEGQWLRAERQSAGRGRLGRGWLSTAGNLHASTLIRLRPGDPPLSGLGLMLGVAVHAALSGLLPEADVQLKWPNDVMAGGAKLAGMLLEREGDAVISGIGVNVAQAPALPDRPTAALADLPGGASLTAAGVLDALVPAVDVWLARWRTGGLSAILPEWQQRAHPPGTRLLLSMGDGQPLAGHFAGLEADGALVLETGDGARHIVHSGDVGLLD